MEPLGFASRAGWLSVVLIIVVILIIAIVVEIL